MRQLGSDNSADDIRLADLLAALSVTLDLGMFRPPGESVRTTVVAASLARHLGLGEMAVRDVFYTALMQDLGCGNTVVDYILGDGEEPVDGVNEELFRAMCEVGRIMADRLQLGGAVRVALFDVFERWDGRGRPHRKAGEEISPATRISRVATHAALFSRLIGVERALDIIRRRSGTCLDPSVCDALMRSPQLMDDRQPDAWEALLAAEPEPVVTIGEDRLDDIAVAFGDRVDMQGTGYSRGHSQGVADLAEEAASLLGGDDDMRRLMRRAGRLHDLGRVAVGAETWTRPGPLTTAEWELVRLHPHHTERILARAPRLSAVAAVAGAHHERCDGSGYHRQVASRELPMSSRLLAAADAFQAMTQRRSHREARTLPDAADVLAADARSGRFDPQAVEAVLAASGLSRPIVRPSPPSGLTDRELEVLRLLAMGYANKQIAARLSIATKTVDNHGLFWVSRG